MAMASDDSKQKAHAAVGNDDELHKMQQKLEELVTDDKQQRLQKFVSNEDAIRVPKDASSSELIQPHGHSEMTSEEDTKQQHVDAEQRKQYFSITAERRSRFHAILNQFDALNFQQCDVSTFKYSLNHVEAHYTLNVTARFSGCKRSSEPTIFYLETMMPGSPDTYWKYWSESEHRLKWDTNIATHRRFLLYEDDATKLEVVNNTTKPVLGGVISPRQFTIIGQKWKLPNNEGIEMAGQTVEFTECSPQKGFVDGWNALCAQRVTAIDRNTLLDVYGVPEIILSNGRTLQWVKIQSMMQTDIKGWLPATIVENAVITSYPQQFKSCRDYMLQNVFGFQMKAEKIQED